MDALEVQRISEGPPSTRSVKGARQEPGEKEDTMSIETMIVELEETVELPEAGANVGGFPCGVIAGVIYVVY